MPFVSVAGIFRICSDKMNLLLQGEENVVLYPKEPSAGLRCGGRFLQQGRDEMGRLLGPTVLWEKEP